MTIFFSVENHSLQKRNYSASNAGPTTPGEIMGGKKAGTEIIWEERYPTQKSKIRVAGRSLTTKGRRLKTVLPTTTTLTFLGPVGFA